MRAFRSPLAILLLLCFVRVLVPDGWLLALHAHQHTLREPAHEAQQRKALLTAQHQHCQTDHFYSVPFQSVPPLELPLPPTLYTAARVPSTEVGWRTAQRLCGYLRGPPTC